LGRRQFPPLVRHRQVERIVQRNRLVVGRHRGGERLRVAPLGEPIRPLDERATGLDRGCVLHPDPPALASVCRIVPNRTHGRLGHWKPNAGRPTSGAAEIHKLLTQRHKEHKEKQIIERGGPIAARVACSTGVSL